MMKVSQSKARTWRMCHFAYHQKYVNKLRKRRMKRPFKFGGIVHEMLEAHANGDNPFKHLKKIEKDQGKLFAAEREMYGDIVADARIIMDAYFDYWPEEDLIYLRKNGKNAEHEFNVEIESGIIATGKIDAVSRTNNKLKWLTEHKTFSRLPSDDHRWRNLQSAVYFKMIQLTGWWTDLSGVCWDYIHSKPPSMPKLTKRGVISKAACNTLPSVVLDFQDRHKLSDEDVADLLAQAEHNTHFYFKRIFTPIQPLVVDTLYNEFVDTAREIAEYHGHKKDRNIGMHCDFCDYEPICRAELTGADVDFIIRREYVVEESRGTIREDETESRSE